MFCDEALDSMEAIAAGETTAEGRVADHLATCPNCAAALVAARQLERVLQRRGAPAPPPQFTARTLARVRRARWRSDQFVDVGFNAAIVVLVVAVFGGVWMLLNRTGLVSLVRRVAPSLPLYAGAAALLASALAVWWWAERDVTL